MISIGDDMATYLKLYAISFTAFLVIDGVWLGVVARGFYKRHLGYLLAPAPNWGAALLFYLLFVGGVVFFVTVPALASGSWSAVLLRGAFFGLITYATYDLTNLATVKDWPMIVAVVDMAWGAVLSATVSIIGFLAGRWMLV